MPALRLQYICFLHDFLITQITGGKCFFAGNGSCKDNHNSYKCRWPKRSNSKRVTRKKPKRSDYASQEHRPKRRFLRHPGPKNSKRKSNTHYRTDLKGSQYLSKQGAVCTAKINERNTCDGGHCFMPAQFLFLCSIRPYKLPIQISSQIGYSQE